MNPTIHRRLRGFPAACALAGAAWLAAGCASMAPPYEAPALPVAAQYPSDAPADAAGATAASLGWRDLSTDPRLQQLIAQALDNNRDLRIAALRVEEARAAYAIQRAEQFPSIGANADASRSRVPADLNITGKPLVSGTYQAGVGMGAWELDFWGRVRSLRDAALENFLASDAARQAVAIGLVAEVANGYLSLRELDERVALARRTIATRQESLRIFTRRFEVGSTSKLDLTQVQTLLTQAQALGVQLEQARASQAHALELLVGAPVDLPTAPSGLEDGSVVQQLRPGLPSDLLAARPDILAAEHQLRAAQANIGAARAAFFPRITLTGSLGTASAEFDGLFKSGSGTWSFAPSLSLPIFDAGRNQAGLDLSQVRRDIAVANYEKTVQSAFREVSDALTAQQRLAEQVRIQQAAQDAQQERARLARLRYDNGAAAFLEVLDAQRDLLSTEQQLVQTRRALLSARVGLYAALGGGAQALPTATTPAH
ncbi:AdeC/AdeK/OprM family multidrug efflux complex outer membrane factor [Ramlibacter sp. H39-3-26]|uniref:AdeC/AdeK/OprM family multidrug efflux complex outer membrane factor n=1 Tax=Curvibacter soli TaxID=3031331 RepID=UPI0023DC08F9|nr:AdeC/AdeK/OprM family multidrug efflux complex outer membrane factor [Ramlibacter sp. H39-3-26]MDF1486123.1 AdeC/AdeK/OprM family multidrug efflux complex outer membrane factor [Ramlibacter sp. H39-3-26]